MKLRTSIALVVGAMVLSSCATTKTAWDHPSKDTTAFYQDDSRCLAMSRGQDTQIATNNDNTSNNTFASSFNQGWNQTQAILAAGDQRRIYTGCMKGQGWRLVEI